MTMDLLISDLFTNIDGYVGFDTVYTKPPVNKPFHVCSVNRNCMETAEYILPYEGRVRILSFIKACKNHKVPYMLHIDDTSCKFLNCNKGAICFKLNNPYRELIYCRVHAKKMWGTEYNIFPYHTFKTFMDKYENGEPYYL